jgi:hypothetical protein
VRRRQRQHRREPARGELRHRRDLVHAVDLVHPEQQRAAGLAQFPEQLAIAPGEAGARVDHEHHDRGLADRQSRLSRAEFGDAFLARGDPTRIHHDERDVRLRGRRRSCGRA